jgi:hypothetical protein
MYWTVPLKFFHFLGNSVWAASDVRLIPQVPMSSHARKTGLLSAAPASALWSTALANDPTCCCMAHPSPSCSDLACSATVCAIDPYCCNSRWDATCATEAAQYCGAAAPNYIDSNGDATPDICAAGG